MRTAHAKRGNTESFLLSLILRTVRHSTPSPFTRRQRKECKLSCDSARNLCGSDEMLTSLYQHGMCTLSVRGSSDARSYWCCWWKMWHIASVPFYWWSTGPWAVCSVISAPDTHTVSPTVPVTCCTAGYAHIGRFPRSECACLPALGATRCYST